MINGGAVSSKGVLQIPVGSLGLGSSKLWLEWC
jgi:hypothetical protein